MGLITGKLIKENLSRVNRKKYYFLKEMEASELITEVRKKFHLTQDDLARILGVSQPTVGSYEAGEIQKPNYKLIKKLEDILEGRIKINPALRGVDKGLFNDLIMGAEAISDEWLTGEMVPKLQDLVARARRSQHGNAARGALGSHSKPPTKGSHVPKKSS